MAVLPTNDSELAALRQRGRFKSKAEPAQVGRASALVRILAAMLHGTGQFFLAETFSIVENRNVGFAFRRKPDRHSARFRCNTVVDQICDSGLQGVTDCAHRFDQRRRKGREVDLLHTKLTLGQRARNVAHLYSSGEGWPLPRYHPSLQDGFESSSKSAKTRSRSAAPSHLPLHVLTQRSINARLIPLVGSRVALEPGHDIGTEAKRQLLLDGPIEEAALGAGPVEEFRRVRGVDGLVAEPPAPPAAPTSAPWKLPSSRSIRSLSAPCPRLRQILEICDRHTRIRKARRDLQRSP